ncbi:hypothetical protein DY000_02039790 [Brassica cretica]|uniref:Uncharacterized protein n=1 Tax=Brassica cretica TaxID=69181 RepID=A0ABQ7B5E5_BRACR|nr:hypothetical protein DY000_02039790 [Brassica cretica]
MTGTRLLDELAQAVRSLVLLFQLNYVRLDSRKGFRYVLENFGDFRTFWSLLNAELHMRVRFRSDVMLILLKSGQCESREEAVEETNGMSIDTALVSIDGDARTRVKLGIDLKYEMVKDAEKVYRAMEAERSLAAGTLWS